MEQSPERRDGILRAQSQRMLLGLEGRDKDVRIHLGH